MTMRLSLLSIGLTSLVVFVAPQTAEAHGQYLDGIAFTIGEELAPPACQLPNNVCGLCHEPAEGDRLENVAVGFGDIVTTVRNGPFYDSLTMNAGWAHAPHAMDANAHRDANLALLLDTALPTMIADMVDSDMDGVTDLAELQAGYNPLLAYEPDDPARSQLCDSAAPFPDEGGDGDGDPDPTGDGDGDPSGDGDGDPDPSGDGDGDPATGDGDGDGESSSGGTEEGSEGETGGDPGSGDEDAGCSCASTPAGEGPLATLALLVLGIGLRRREASTKGR